MTDETTPFVKITNREIWDALRQLESGVTRMDNRINDILSENVELRKRVRALELKTYTIMAGFTTALVAGALALLQGAFGG